MSDTRFLPVTYNPADGTLRPTSTNGIPLAVGMSPTGVLALSGFSSITGTLPQANLQNAAYAYRDIPLLSAAEVDNRLVGQSAGTSAQNIFSTRNDSGSGTYVRSTTSFVYGVDLTPISVYCDDGLTTSTATLLSPRHVLLVHHAVPSNGVTFRFVTNSNTVVTRTLTSSTRVGSTDIRIGLLSSDVPSSITFAKVLNATQRARLLGAPVVRNDQNQKATVADISALSATDDSFALPSESNRSPFFTAWISGDSGHPAFLVQDAQMVVLCAAHAVNGGDDIAVNYAAINSVMTSLGGGYQLTPFNAGAVLSNAAYLNASSTPIAGEIVLAGAGGKLFSNLVSSSLGSYALIGSDADENILTADETGLNFTTNITAFNFATGKAALMRSALGLVIGINVQAYDADLTTWAGITPGTGVGTALGVNVGTAGAFVVNGGALGTPLSGTVTNLTGTASININGTVGATTPAAGTFTTLVAGSTTSLLLGTAGSAVGNIGFRNATSGTVTLAPPTGALGTYTVTLPNAASTLPIYGQQITHSGFTAARTITWPDAAITVARTDAANTFTGTQIISGITSASSSDLTLSAGATNQNIRFVPSGTGRVETRNGTTAQVNYIYKTYTDASNFEAMYVGWNTFWAGYVFSTDYAGTGVARPISIIGTTIGFGSANSGTYRWNIDTNGHFVAATDNTYDIGASGATRPRNVYVAGTLNIAGASTLVGAVTQTAKTTTYNNIATAGNGIPAIVKSTRVTAQSAANNSICTYTAPASDGSYEVSMNLNATAVTVLSASLNCDYTDESNTARTMIFPVQSLAGNFVTGGLITTTGPYETPVMHIRCKASTAITLYTSTGTYTDVTYTAEGIIKCVQ